MSSNNNNTSNKIKDSLKGIISVGAGAFLVILGFVWITILPLSIVLWIIGCPLVVNGIRTIFSRKQNNTDNGSRLSSSSNNSNVRRYGRPQNPNSDEELISVSDVRDAIVGMSNGYVNVVEAYVSRDFNNRFTITITLEKLVGWEGPYCGSAYNENARSMVNDVSSTVSRLGGSSRVSFTWR